MTKFQILNIDFKNSYEEPRGSKIKSWCKVNDRLGLIKLNNYEAHNDELIETRSWGVSEKIFSEIAFFLGYSCVEIDFVVNKEGLYGIVSYDYRKEGVLEISGDDLYLNSSVPLPEKKIKPNNESNIDENYNYEDILKILTFYDKDFSLVINFNKIVLMDALTGESDRHYKNWSIAQQNNDYFLFPMYDNASCLLYQFRDNEILEDTMNKRDIRNYATRSISKIKIGCKKYKHYQFIQYLLENLPDMPKNYLITDIKNLKTLTNNYINNLIDKIPSKLCQDKHKKLIVEYIIVRRDALLNLVEDL